MDLSDWQKKNIQKRLTITLFDSFDLDYKGRKFNHDSDEDLEDLNKQEEHYSDEYSEYKALQKEVELILKHDFPGRIYSIDTIKKINRYKSLKDKLYP